MNKNVLLYLLTKYNEVRYADRGLFFKKSPKKRIDPRTISDVIDYFEISHVQGYFLKNDGVLYVIIIGSNQVVDWAYNLWFRRMEVPYSKKTNHDIKVHKGFYRSYLMIRDHLLEKIKNEDNIIVYGQSLGAAIATLAALDIQYNHPDKRVSSVTTGSPRVGNLYFRLSYSNRVQDTARFVYGNDIVTHLPPLLTKYKHVSHEIHLGPPKKKFTLSISDHMISSYIPGMHEWNGEDY